VVVKDVPAGATAVGIPARILEKRQDDGAFSAYAVGSDMNDPMVRAVHELIDHSVATDKRIDKILEQLQKMGIDCTEARPRDHFDANHLNKMVD
jgi:serine O-acetyltransferase